MKLSWRQISEAEKSKYHTAKAKFPDGSSRLVGLVGFHIAKNTKWHDEFIWSTFEHIDNAPDCENPQAPSPAGWSFVSDDCAACMMSYGLDNCAKSEKSVCGNINKGRIVKGFGLINQIPTNVCRKHPHGGGSQESIEAVKSLNNELVGPKMGFLTLLPPGDPMSIWKNYFHVGTTWLPPLPNPLRDFGNVLGSKNLSNVTMESFIQDSNCMDCHPYPADWVATGVISHILPDKIDD